MKPAISKLAAILLADALLAACANGKAVRVDCDGPLTLINQPAGAGAKDGAARGVAPAGDTQPDRSVAKAAR